MDGILFSCKRILVPAVWRAAPAVLQFRLALIRERVELDFQP